jgi:hypothetical protein
MELLAINEKITVDIQFRIEIKVMKYHKDSFID